MQRRTLLSGAAALSGLAMIGVPLRARAETFAFTLTEAAWRARLSPDAYAVLREEDTERPFTSPLDTETRAGTYHCAGCDLPAYASAAKYDSGTGWPSFSAALAGAVGTKEDNTFFSTRTEVHCRRCGGHFGHIFDDGPAPTGKRHCLNGVALAFNAA
jgi:peptide-methionine (R)-S-oxide reductase